MAFVIQVFDNAGKVGGKLNFIQRHGHGLVRVQTAVAQVIEHQIIIFLLKDGALIQPLKVEIDLVVRVDLLQ